MANHIPYGYRIENGVAVIDESQAEQVRTLFSGYLSGLALVPAAQKPQGLPYSTAAQKGCSRTSITWAMIFILRSLTARPFPRSQKSEIAVPEHWEESGSGEHRRPAKQRPPLL